MKRENRNPHGTLYVISAPSGAGKTSLVKALLAGEPSHFGVGISHTTRAPRAGECEGKDYFFVDHKTFNTMIKQGAFVEYARVFDHFYGTSKAEIDRLIFQGKDVILEIDWQGARQVKRAFTDVVSIFILPPSLAVLQARLIKRGLDSEAVIAARMAKAEAEISHAAEYDYVIVNADFDKALEDLRAVFRTRSLK